MRNLTDVIDEIISIIPDSFSRKETVVGRLNDVKNDNLERVKYMPFLNCIAWKDVQIILSQEILPISENTMHWTWADDVYYVFMDGNWVKKIVFDLFNKKYNMICSK